MLNIFYKLIIIILYGYFPAIFTSPDLIPLEIRFCVLLPIQCIISFLFLEIIDDYDKQI